MDIELTSELTVDSLRDLLEKSLVVHGLSMQSVEKDQLIHFFHQVKGNEDRSNFQLCIYEGDRIVASIGHSPGLSADYDKYGIFYSPRIWITLFGKTVMEVKSSIKIILHPHVLGLKATDNPR